MYSRNDRSPCRKRVMASNVRAFYRGAAYRNLLSYTF